MATTDEVPVTEVDKLQVIEEGPTLPALLTDDFVSQFEKGVAVYKRWVSVCYRLTRETHWVNHGSAEKPRYSLQGPGAEALMNPLGISYERPTFSREDKHDERGDFYIWWCEGYVESRTLGRRGWYVGYCDSRDPFFNARPGWNPKSGEGDVKKSAMTNWIVNAVTRIAGLRDPDPALLLAAGLDPGKIQGIDYSGRRSPDADKSVISEAQGKRLWAIAKEKGVSEEKLRKKLAANGIASFKDIPRGQYDAVVGWVERGGPDENGGNGGHHAA